MTYHWTRIVRRSQFSLSSLRNPPILAFHNCCLSLLVSQTPPLRRAILRPLWKILLSFFLLISWIFLWISIESSDDGQFSLSFEASFSGLRAHGIRRLLRVSIQNYGGQSFSRCPSLRRRQRFSACSSSASYHSEAPIHSIMSRIVVSLERAWPASSMLIYIEADQAVGLLLIHTEPGRSITAAGVNVP